MTISCLYPRPTKLEVGYTGFTMSVRPSVRPSVCRWHGFWSVSQDCFGILISNFICMLMVAMGRSLLILLIFSDVTFKMAAWWPYWIFWFPDSNFTLAKYLCIWVRAYWFSVTSFSKWLPGGHIRFFGFCMAWFRQHNSNLLWNFSFKFHAHVRCGCRQKPNDCQLCRFQNGCLVILNNVQLQYTHCPLPPSPMGRGYPSRSLIYNF